MATAWNDVTGARLVSKANTKAYDANYDAVFKKAPTVVKVELVLPLSQIGVFSEPQLSAAVDVAEFQMVDQTPAEVRTRLVKLMATNHGEQSTTTDLAIAATLGDRIMSLARCMDVHPNLMATYLANFYIVSHDQ